MINVLELDQRIVPSPFGEGGIDSGVASSLLLSLLVHDDRIWREERQAPSSGNQQTLNSPQRRASI